MRLEISPTASDPAPADLYFATLTEDLVLALLQHSDLAPEIIQKIGKNGGVIKSRKVRLAIAAHPRTARRLSLRLIREFYPADLVRLAFLPAVAADLKHAAAELLITRLPSITLGERISLARRAPETVTATLLLDKDSPVWQAALENPRLTETSIVKALQRSVVTDAFVAFLCRHSKWSIHPEIRAALLVNEKTPLASTLNFIHTLSPAQVRDILHVSRLPLKVRDLLEKALRESCHKSHGPAPASA